MISAWSCGQSASRKTPGRCTSGPWPSTEAAYGPDHPYVAIYLNNLGLALRDLGQPQDARPLYERALAIDEATYGPTTLVSPSTGTTSAWSCGTSASRKTTTRLPKKKSRRGNYAAEGAVALPG